MAGEVNAGEAIERLREIMAELRGPGGCPWDLEQSHESLKKYAVEETYELLDAIDSGSDEKMREELGDVLLQVVFHAQLATERGAFTLADVIDGIANKLVDRHPHVFGEITVADSSEVLANWERQKLAEGAGRKHVLEGVPRSLPALLMTHRIAEKIRRQSSSPQSETIAVNPQNIGESLQKLALLAHDWGLNPEEELRKINLKELDQC